ncbi:RNA-directed DNA polymerase, partial [bacterium]|nr:RNA-directed DNA polymerase [bacterium]
MNNTYEASHISVKAINQYRGRDIFPYISLRYYLYNSATRSSRWAQDAAVKMVISRSSTPYFRSKHYKELDTSSEIVYRDIYLPGANEALAEASLLDECSKHPGIFSNHPSVFSYELTKSTDLSGIYLPFMSGVIKRHSTISSICSNNTEFRVHTVDIKRFYPSISHELAVSAWDHHARLAGFDVFRDLGNKIITDYRNSSHSGDNGILTGPMFSHLIANLVLREFDEYCSTKLPAHYIRYVDDISLIGTQQQIDHSINIIKSKLESLGFHLHDKNKANKNILVSAEEWLSCANINNSNHISTQWMKLIFGIK